MRVPGCALVPLAVAFAVVAATPAEAYRVEEWSVAWTQQIDALGNPVTLADDFEDGVFPGFPQYGVLCGSVAPGDEAGGSLLIGNDAEFGPGCGGIELFATNITGIGEMVATVTYDFVSPPVDQFYGISIGNVGGTDFASMSVGRAVLPVFGDSVVISILDESFTGLNAVQQTILLATPELLDAVFSSITLELRLSQSGFELLPTGRFRFDDDPFVDLDPGILAPRDDGALSVIELHGASLVATPEPGTAPLLAFGLIALGRMRGRRDRRAAPTTR